VIMKLLTSLIVLIVIFSFFPSSYFFAVNKEFFNQIKKSVVFLGNVNNKGEYSPFATGFLINIRNVTHLVTAKHVVIECKNSQFTGKFINNGLCVFFNNIDGMIASRSIDDIKKNYGVNWIFHNNDVVDIALIPFPLHKGKDDVRTIPEHIFWSTDKLFEFYDVFYLSYQPGIKFEKMIFPITRNGTISLINDDKTIFIDGFAFPGNSGSPVFIKPFPIRFNKDSFTIEGELPPSECKFIGVIGGYIPYQESAVSTQTGRTRILFEENTGLSKVWSFTFINEITESDIFKKQLINLTKQ